MQTQVGDSETRGISGGERKRLTTAEILVGQQVVAFMVRCGWRVAAWLAGGMGGQGGLWSGGGGRGGPTSAGVHGRARLSGPAQATHFA